MNAKTKNILEIKIEEANNDIMNFLDQDKEETYLIVLLNFFIVHKFMIAYLKEHEEIYLSILDESKKAQDLLEHMLKDFNYTRYLNILSTTYAYSSYSYNEFLNMPIDDLKKIKNNLTK